VFLVASVIALILNPLVKLVLLIDPASQQVETFQRDVPSLVRDANRSLAHVQDYLDRKGINVRVKEQGQTALETIQKRVLHGSGDVVAFTRDIVQRLIEGAFAFVLVLVISVYMLLYAEGSGGLVRRLMPPGDGSPEDDFPLRVQKAVFSYVRGQLLFSLIMGTTAGIALWIFGLLGIFPDGRTYALAFGAFFGAMELVPYFGPVLGALPPVLVALLGDPLTALWVGLLFLALQQLEGHVVAPQVFGHSLRLNPLIIIFALLLGAEIYGIIGAFIALPLAAVGRETVVYLSRYLVLEPWGTPVRANAPPAPPPPPAEPTPEAGEPAEREPVAG